MANSGPNYEMHCQLQPKKDAVLAVNVAVQNTYKTEYISLKSKYVKQVAKLPGL